MPGDRAVFAKTGTAVGGSEFLMVGASGPHVLVMWVGRAQRPAPIHADEAAGAVLGAAWGRVMGAAALEV